jgi:hypothetical protein
LFIGVSISEADAADKNLMRVKSPPQFSPLELLREAREVNRKAAAFLRPVPFFANPLKPRRGG